MTPCAECLTGRVVGEENPGAGALRTPGMVENLWLPTEGKRLRPLNSPGYRRKTRTGVPPESGCCQVCGAQSGGKFEAVLLTGARAQRRALQRRAVLVRCALAGVRDRQLRVVATPASILIGRGQLVLCTPGPQPACYRLMRHRRPTIGLSFSHCQSDALIGF